MSHDALSLNEAAAALGVSRNTLRTRMRAKGIAPVTVGRGQGIASNDLQTLRGGSTQAYAAGDLSRAALTREQAVGWLGSLFNTVTSDPDQLLSELRLPRSTLRKLMGDDEIAQATSTRLDGLLATPWRIEAGQDTDQEDERVVWLWGQFEPHAESVIASCWNAVLYGYSVQEVIYRWESGRYGWARISEKPFEWFAPQADGTLLYRGEKGLPVLVPHEKFLLVRHRPSWRNPCGEALLARLYWAWCYRTHGWKFWANWLERFGMPFLVGKAAQPDAVVDPATGKTAVQAMMEALSAAGRGSAIVVDRDSSVEALNPTGNNDAFASFDRAISARIQKLILGQTLTSDVGNTGSYAAAQVHNLVREDKKRADARLVSEAVNRLITTLWRLNGWSDAAPRVVLDAGTGLSADRAARDAALVKAGILELTPRYLLDRYDFEEGDFVVPAQRAPRTETQTAASIEALYSPGRARRFTPGQQSLEELADLALSRAEAPITVAELRAAAKDAQSPEELLEKLAQTVFSGRDSDALQDALDAALYAADVLGYVNSSRQTF